MLILKAITQELPSRRRCLGHDLGVGGLLLLCVHQPPGSPNPVTWGFMKFVTWAGLIKALATGDWAQFSSSPLLRRAVVGASFSHVSKSPSLMLSFQGPPRITSLAQNSGLVERGLLWMTNNAPVTPYSGNSKDFRSSVSGTWTETKYVYFLSHTV